MTSSPPLPPTSGSPTCRSSSTATRSMVSRAASRPGFGASRRSFGSRAAATRAWARTSPTRPPSTVAFSGPGRCWRSRAAGRWTASPGTSMGLTFPGGPPTHEVSRTYRRWALESAALDLALRQGGRALHDVLGRSTGAGALRRLAEPRTASDLCVAAEPTGGLPAVALQARRHRAVGRRAAGMPGRQRHASTRSTSRASTRARCRRRTPTRTCTAGSPRRCPTSGWKTPTSRTRPPARR